METYETEKLQRDHGRIYERLQEIRSDANADHREILKMLRILNANLKDLSADLERLTAYTMEMCERIE